MHIYILHDNMYDISNLNPSPPPCTPVISYSVASSLEPYTQMFQIAVGSDTIGRKWTPQHISAFALCMLGNTIIGFEHPEVTYAPDIQIVFVQITTRKAKKVLRCNPHSQTPLMDTVSRRT